MKDTPTDSILVSFLGTGDYVKVFYGLDGKTCERDEEFVQVALIDLLGTVAPTRAIVFLTEDARAKHFAGLQRALGDRVALTPVSIPNGSQQDELWKIFSTIGEAIPEGSRVIFDMTHGLRSLPLVASLSLSFFRHLRSIEVVGVYYGAFEALGPPAVIKKLCADLRTRLDSGELSFDEFRQKMGVAPVFDLTDMFALPAWAEALSEWQRTGRPGGLVNLTDPYLADLKRRLRQNAPESLVRLPSKLALVGDTLEAMRSDRIGEATLDALKCIEAAKAEIRGHVSLAPLELALTSLAESVRMLAVDRADGAESVTDAYLEQQIALAAWYEGHGDLSKALSVLRECITSACVRCAIEAGIRELSDGPRIARFHSSAFRGAIESIVTSLACPDLGDERPRDEDAAEKLRVWAADEGLLFERYRLAQVAIRNQRNKLNHCWTGEEHSKERWNQHSLSNLAKLTRDAVEVVRAFVGAVCDRSREVRRSLDGDVLAFGVES